MTTVYISGAKVSLRAMSDLQCLSQKDNPNKPRIYMAMGTDDFLYENTKPLRKRFADYNYDFTYIEEEHANHSWAFWDAQIQNVLKWMFNKG